LEKKEYSLQLSENRYQELENMVYEIPEIFEDEEFLERMRELHVGNDERSGGKPNRIDDKNKISNVVHENKLLKLRLEEAIKEIEGIRKEDDVFDKDGTDKVVGFHKRRESYASKALVDKIRNLKIEVLNYKNENIRMIENSKNLESTYVKLNNALKRANHRIKELEDLSNNSANPSLPTATSLNSGGISSNPIRLNTKSP
jgi:hypothetical protein